jgi:LacI family transcriptional regulator
VARVAGVSPNTVSLVVQNSPLVTQAMKERVQAVIERLGYRPHAAAAALRSARSHTLGYLVQRGYEEPRQSGTASELFAAIDVSHNQLISAIGARAQAADHYLLVDMFVDVQRCLDLLSGARIDGALVDWLIPDSVLRDLVGHHIPVVLVGRDAGDLPVSWVKADEEGGSREVIRHLHALGHRHIGMLSANGPQKYPNAQTLEREAGYRRALAEADLPLDPRTVMYGDWTLKSGYERGMELLSLDPFPSAVYVLGEYMAAGLLEAAARRGLRVPGDVAIATSQGTLLAEVVQPRLTALHVPIYDVGLRATDVLLNMLADPTGPLQQIILPTSLVVRESTVPAPAYSSTAAGQDRDSQSPVPLAAFPQATAELERTATE